MIFCRAKPGSRYIAAMRARLRMRMMKMMWMMGMTVSFTVLGCAEKLPEDHVMPVVQAERAFSARSGERGTKAAFLEYLTADATVLDPGPQPGRAYYQVQPDVAGKRTWKPSYAEISASGELGYTAGPYTVAQQDGRLQFGHYAAVWRKQADGAWKVVADGSSQHPPPLQVAEALAYLPAQTGKKPAQVVVAAELRRLEAAERVLLLAWKTRGSAALLEYATDDLRYLPPDALPLQGRGAVQAGLGMRRDELTFRPGGGGVAASGDLGYTYGAATRKAGPSASLEAGGYLRIWRRSARGVWLVALELHTMPARAGGVTKAIMVAPGDLGTEDVEEGEDVEARPVERAVAD